MNNTYIYATFYISALVIATLATYFVHLPTEFLIGIFGLVLGSGLPSVIPTTSTPQIGRPL